MIAFSTLLFLPLIFLIVTSIGVGFLCRVAYASLFQRYYVQIHSVLNESEDEIEWAEWVDYSDDKTARSLESSMDIISHIKGIEMTRIRLVKRQPFHFILVLFNRYKIQLFIDNKWKKYDKTFQLEEALRRAKELQEWSPYQVRVKKSFPCWNGNSIPGGLT